MFKIYVGNLDYKVKVEQLRELFSVFAPIEDLVIPLDSQTNRAKGFAIVMIRDPELGHAAIKAMQGKRLMGRTLVVNEAAKKRKGAEAPVTKAELLRNGPFGPRMFRFGDPRGGGGRPSSRSNPRRGSLRGDGESRGSASSPPTASQAGSTPASASGASAASHSARGAAAGGVRPAGGSATSPTPGSPAPRPPSATPPAKPTSASPPAGASTPAPPAPAPPARPKAQRLATPKPPLAPPSSDAAPS